MGRGTKTGLGKRREMRKEWEGESSAEPNFSANGEVGKSAGRERLGLPYVRPPQTVKDGAINHQF